MSRVVAIVGSYRQGGTIDMAVEAVLDGAREAGAETETIYLRDEPIEFCTNCRSCTQEPGPGLGTCVQNDAMKEILAKLETADAVVLASPVNFYNVTAIFRRFMERLVGYAYWPWGKSAPQTRRHMHKLKAVLVASAAMPGAMVPVFTGAARALRGTAKVLGARPVGRLWIGMAGAELDYRPPKKALAKARRLGMRLA